MRQQPSRCPVQPPPLITLDWRALDTKVSTMVATPGFNMTAAEQQTDLEHHVTAIANRQGPPDTPVTGNRVSTDQS